ncbi:postpolyketide modification protein [Mycobacterium lentiflavum]|uniref:Postpolyketide modification protein n=1 Tax=Mycobacterium lentiflavum TaxID=141349 RepID=A0A0E4GZE8_MYCLN|nr:spirocyclase AveC family protein [Mycobacterium lentiflavum]CQD17432.1 postpolyketide modification protein [Mycobacterium lentiflavum]
MSSGLDKVDATRPRADAAPRVPIRAAKVPWRWQHYLAAIAGLFLFWGAWTLVAWVAAGPRPVTEYRDPGSSAYAIATAYEVGTVLLVLGVGSYVIRGCLRQRRLTFDAQLCIAGLLAYWLDPFYNFIVPMNLYSSNFVNVGSWCSYAPFVINKACSGSPEPILVIGAIYLVGFLVIAMVGGRILRLVEARYPGASPARMLLAVALFAIIVDLLIDGISSQLDLWSQFIPAGLNIATAARPFPATLPLSAILFFGAPTFARYLRDDMGRTLFERGLDHLRPPARRALSFLSLVGYMQLMVAVTILITIAPVGLYANNSPVYPAHIINGQCDIGSGHGSAYGPCPGTPGFTAPLRHLLHP